MRNDALGDAQDKLDAVENAIRVLEADAWPGVRDAAAAGLRKAFAVELERRSAGLLNEDE